MTQTIDLASAARTFYRELDDSDRDVFQRRLAVDARFTFNAIEPVTGVDAIARFVAGWKGNFDALLHEVDRLTIDTTTNTVGVELGARYVFRDGTKVDLKGCAFLEFLDGAIVDWRVYVDTSRLSVSATGTD
jgi:ketosteroid isomerase-like protein